MIIIINTSTIIKTSKCKYSNKQVQFHQPIKKGPSLMTKALFTRLQLRASNTFASILLFRSLLSLLSYLAIQDHSILQNIPFTNFPLAPPIKETHLAHSYLSLNCKILFVLQLNIRFPSLSANTYR